MTMPDERYRSVLNTAQFLKDLCDPTKTPRVPRDVRRQASWCLRHYPGTWDMDRAAHHCPEVFESQNKLDDVQAFILKGLDTASK
jgi:hypothetical protein